MRTFKITLALFLTALLVWLGGYAVFALSALRVPSQEAGGDTTDAIIVLTGGNHRIKTGLELFAAGRARHLFISGVNPKVSTRDVTAMWNGDTALPPCCITLGHEAETTFENAQEARQWIAGHDYTSAILVTSTYHMKRALIEFRHALPGVDLTPYPVPYKDYGPKDRYFWILAFSEYNKGLLRRFQLFFIPVEALDEEESG